MLLFDFPRMLRFFFTFQFFFFSVFFLFFDVFCTLPHNQENHDSKQIPLKYDFNMRLLKSCVDWGKNIDFSLCIQALYVKAIRPYPKHLGISYCMCNVLKASLLCEFVANFCFVLVLIALNSFLFSLTKFFFNVYIYLQ